MNKKEILSVARALLEKPTAPFFEDAVRDEIEAQLRKCPHVECNRDDFGNVIARYRRKGGKPRWAFAAHMDHPGWGRPPGSSEEYRFLGSVRESFLANPKIKSYGDFAMWDLPAFGLKEGKIFSRGCDDIIGCAEIICLFRELEATEAEVHCLGLFSRAEEVGFIGAIKIAESGILPKDITVLSLETSAPRGSAVMGRGPIIRVGDKTAVFDSAATARLLAVAQAAKIPVQRCLLDAGTCEATAYQLYGITAAAASIALGNYHNCAEDGTIASEFVAVDDYAAMIRLCVALAITDAKADDPQRKLRRELAANVRNLRAFHSGKKAGRA